MNPYYFAFSHAVSPSGDLVATITFNAKASDIDIVLLSTRDGKIVKNITQGFTSRYETIRYEIDPSLGRSLAWSRDGDTLAFFARDGRRHSLFLVDVLTGDVVKRLPLSLDQPVSPGFTPDGRTLLFSAFERGTRDIFSIDLAERRGRQPDPATRSTKRPRPSRPTGRCSPTRSASTARTSSSSRRSPTCGRSAS